MSENILPTEVALALGEVPNPVVFELGACDGYHSKFILQACKGKPRMFSFEPDPRNIIKCISALAPLNIDFVPDAVGNKTGPVMFHLAHLDSAQNTGSSSISPFKRQTEIFPWCTEIGQIAVKCWRLDDFCAEYKVDHIDFIWMDVQGAEAMVIDGARQILAKTRYLYTEFEGVDKEHATDCYEDSSTLDRILNLLPGWQIVKVYDYDALLKNTLV